MEQQYNGKKKIMEARLASARSKQQEYGLSPRQLGEIAEYQTLFQAYRWGYTTSKIIQTLLSRTSGGYLDKLTEKGLLVKTPTQSGYPRYFYSLSPDGLAKVQARQDELLNYSEINPHRVNQSILNHNLICQEVTLLAFKAQQISHYQTERQFFVEGLPKVPDCIWDVWEDERIGVEIELTQKWGIDLHKFMLGIWETLENVDNPLALKRFIIFSSSPAILKNYKSAISPGKFLPKYAKDERGRWTIVKQLEVPEWLSSRVDFKLIERV